MNFKYKDKEYELVFLTKTGSRMYGNYREDSDWDYRGIFIESIENKISLKNESIEVIGGASSDGLELYNILKNLNLDLNETNDIELYELTKFTRLALDNNPNIMDLLCSNISNATYISDKGKEILNKKDLFLSKELKKTFTGYALTQLSKMKNHGKWVNDFPDTHIILDKLKEFYENKKIDFDWITDNFGGQVALKVSNENSQNKVRLDDTISWNDFEKNLLLNNVLSDPNKYRLPRLVEYCNAKDLRGKTLKFKGETFDKRYSSELEELLNSKCSYRTLSPSMLVLYSEGNGLITKEGSLKPNDPKHIGEFICLLTIDHMRFKSDRDHINKMWNWKCNRNEVRGVMEDRYGYDLKHASHLIRLLDACEEILQTNDYVPELSGERLDRVKRVRNGNFSYEYIIKYAKEQESKLEILQEKSTLPEKSNINEVDKMMKRFYLSEFNERYIDINI